MDASKITAGGQASEGNPVELTVLLSTQTTLIVGRRMIRSTRSDDDQWLAFLDDVKTIAYPG